tara:strand:- start:124 stop:462 length:339 start_codon:yes stop_codon:yes gene_type:complete
MKIVKKMINRYSKYVDKNEKIIINEFCEKIKKHKIGDLTLDEYSRFKFWKIETDEHLRDFFQAFKDDTKDKEIDYETFCEFTWNTVEDYIDEVPEDVKTVLQGLKDNTGAEA